MEEVLDKFNNKHLSQTMFTMLAIAGYADMYELIDFKQQEIGDYNYYNMYTMTTDQENEFRDWMFKKLGEAPYRKDMCRFPNLCKSKRMKMQFVDNFISNYGLKIKNNE